MNESIMQKMVTTNRPKVNRDSSLKAVIDPTTSIKANTTTSTTELEKKTVRISSEAITYYTELKNTNKITLDGILEAIPIYIKEHPEFEQDLIAIAKQVLKTRQESANTARATTMYEKYRQS